MLLPALLLGVLAALGHWTGFQLLLFPEMAALGYELFRYPQGHFASKPLLVVVSPLLAGVWGWELEQALGFSPFTVLLAVVGTLGLLQLLRSAITPSLSAAILPLVLGIRSPLYILGIGLGTAGLVWLFRVWTPTRPRVPLPLPPRRGALAHGLLLLALLGLAILAVLTRFPLLLYPPLGVLGYETLTGHQCAWRQAPLRMVAAVGLTGTIGFGLRFLLGPGPLGVVLAFLLGVLVLRGLQLSIPPALAVGVLPFVAPRVTWLYPLAVTFGAAVMVVLLRLIHHLESRPQGSPTQTEEWTGQGVP